MINETFKRQVRILNPSDIVSKVHIFGVGTIGSFTAFCLTKMGVSDLVIYDCDNVERHNVSNQLYKRDQIDRQKTEALKETLEDLAPQHISVELKNGFINRETRLTINENDIVILCFDNLKARRIVFDKIKRKRINLIDSRMNAEEFRIFALNTTDRKRLEKYKESLNPVRMVQASCGEQSISYNAFSIAGVIGSIVKKMLKSEHYPFEIDLSLRTFDVVKEE